WAVVTSGTRAVAAARLTGAGLPTPPVLVTAEDVPAGKPDPAPYRLAATPLRLDPAHRPAIQDPPPRPPPAPPARCPTPAPRPPLPAALTAPPAPAPPATPPPPGSPVPTAETS